MSLLAPIFSSVSHVIPCQAANSKIITFGSNDEDDDDDDWMKSSKKLPGKKKDMEARGTEASDIVASSSVLKLVPRERARNSNLNISASGKRKSTQSSLSSASSDDEHSAEEGEENSDTERFNIKPQFEGKSGAKVCKVQSLLEVARRLVTQTQILMCNLFVFEFKIPVMILRNCNYPTCTI